MPSKLRARPPYIQLLASLVIMVVLFVAMQLLAPKPNIEDARPAGLGDFEFPTAREDRTVPIWWGTMEFTGPNVIWYGDLQVVAVKKKIKKNLWSSVTIVVAHRYFIGMDLLLGYGPVERVLKLEVSDVLVYGDPSLVGLEAEPAIALTGLDSGADLTIADRHLELFGGKEHGGGIAGTFRCYGGTEDQTQDPYLQSVLGDDIPAYGGIAHIVAEQFEVGESAHIGRYVFRATRFPDNLLLDGGNHIVNGSIINGDSNPAEVIYEILTSDTFGLQMDASRINFDSFQAAGNRLADEGNGWTSIHHTKIAAGDLIREVLRQIDGFIFEDSTGVFRLKLARDDYDKSAWTQGGLAIDGTAEKPVLLFDESNVVELQNFARGAWSNTQNDINIGYTDRNKEFIATGAMAQDMANARIQGERVRADINFPGCKHPTLAKNIAMRELQQLSFPLAKVKLRTNRDGALVQPGDVIRLSWPKLGMTELVIRVLSIDLGEILDSAITIEGIQDVFRIPESIFAEPQATSWTPADTAAYEIVNQLYREAGRIQLNMAVNATLILDPYQHRFIGVAETPVTTGIYWRPFIDDGTGNYVDTAATSDGFTPRGVLNAEYLKSTSDVDSGGTVVVSDISRSFLLEDTNATSIYSGSNLALIQGATQEEDEWIGWETRVDNGDGTHTFTGVHRGLLDSQARTHAASSVIWFFYEGNVLSWGNAFEPNETLTIKSQMHTSGDDFDLDGQGTTSLTFASRLTRPHHPARFRVNGTRVPQVTDKSADLVFDWEMRENSNDGIYDADDYQGQSTDVTVPATASRGSYTIPGHYWDQDVEFDLSFYHAFTEAQLGSTHTISSSGLTPGVPDSAWTTYTYTSADLQTQTGEVGSFPLQVRMRSRLDSDDTESLQEIRHDFNVDMGGDTDQSIEFNGTDEYLANTTHQTWGIADTWTVAMWLRPGHATGGIERDAFELAYYLIPAWQNRIKIGTTASSDSFRVVVGALPNKDYKFGTWTQNTWHHVAVTWDGTDLLVYVDGVEDSSPTKTADFAITMADGARQCSVGSSGGGDFWQGHVYGGPAIWSTKLSAAEIAAIASDGQFNLRANSGNYASHDTLVHLYDYRKTSDFGADFGNASVTKVDIDTNAVNVTSGNLDTVEKPA